MNVLPFIDAVPHLLTAINPSDGHFAVLAVLAGMAVSIKFSMARQQAKVRREKFIRERQSAKDSQLQRDNEHQ